VHSSEDRSTVRQVVKRPISIVLLYWEAESNATLSYQHGWPRAFLGNAVV